MSLLSHNPKTVGFVSTMQRLLYSHVPRPVHCVHPKTTCSCCYNSQFQSVSGSDAADLKNNLTQTRSFKFSDSTEIGGILIPFPPAKLLLWRMFLFPPSGPATTFHNSSQYLALMQLILKIISHKPGHLSFPILLK